MSLTKKYSLVFKLVDNPKKQSLTSSFRTIDRDQRPSYASRYVRDFNDLNYETPSIFSRSQSQQQMKNTSSQKKQTKKISQTKEIAKPSAPGVESSSYKFQAYFIQSGVPTEDQSVSLTDASKKILPSLKKQDQKNFGLSGYEFENTIVGKIDKKQSHHLNFEKSPKRPININKVWYSHDHDYSPSNQEDLAKKAKKAHAFISDSPHIAFKPRDGVQKHYEIEQAAKLIRQRSDMTIRPMERVKPRPELQKKIGTQLNYQKSRSLLNKKMPLFRISRIQRNLEYPRQVISSNMGCYR